MICRAMYGNGVRIYIAKMPIKNTSVKTLYILGAVPAAVLFAAAAGAADRGMCVWLIAAAAHRISGPSSLASASPGHRRVLVFHFLFSGLDLPSLFEPPSKLEFRCQVS